jgi:ElaB/YqjD/DUF883 family membrane-anchored ribosome-binding protein
MDEVPRSGADTGDDGAQGREETKESFWSEARARSRVAGERVGAEWERLSENAKDYADEHSIGVALGSLGVGIAIGVLLGVLIARD